MNFDDVLKKPKHCAYNAYYSKTIFGNIGKSTMEPRSTRSTSEPNATSTSVKILI